MTIDELLSTTESVFGDLNRELQVTAAASADLMFRLEAAIRGRNAALAEIARLTAPPDRLPVGVVNDLWVSGQLRLLKLPTRVQQRWQPVAALIESQLRDAAGSGGVRRAVPWLASVIADAIADKLVTTEELAAAGFTSPGVTA